MTSYKKFFPSKYLKAHDLESVENLAVTIAGIRMEEVEVQNGGTEEKPVLSFKDNSKRLILNRTNAEAIAESYGEDVTRWADACIFLYVERNVRAFGKAWDVVRVRDHHETQALLDQGGQIQPAKEAPMVRFVKAATRLTGELPGAVVNDILGGHELETITAIDPDDTDTMEAVYRELKAALDKQKAPTPEEDTNQIDAFDQQYQRCKELAEALGPEHKTAMLASLDECKTVDELKQFEAMLRDIEAVPDAAPDEHDAVPA